jgi:hypothetical protein
MAHEQLERKANKISKIKSGIGTIFLKLVIIILWGLFILLNTWTESIERLIYLYDFGFRWESNPNFLSFFYFDDITQIHQEFITVKLGHFIGFAIMELLLFNLLKSHKYSIGISIVFAFITEFFQLFFGRDGRFYDLLIDSLGILAVFLIIKKTSV